jgi:hypothetical protein
MRINKITHGCVIQAWDTELNRWISQEFIAGEPVEYEQAGSNRVLDPAEIWPDTQEPYLPFLMTQPDEINKANHSPVQPDLA